MQMREREMSERNWIMAEELGLLKHDQREKLSNTAEA